MCVLVSKAAAFWFAQRNSRCSECVCEAIELHYERRLQELLHEPGVYYADTFWAPAPRARFQRVARRGEHVSWEYHTNVGETGAPKDLRESCGHMLIDAELRARIDVEQRFYLLVSLVQVAVEHTDDADDGFNPLQILADSGKFDLSEPLIYHQPAFHTDCIMDVRLEPTTGVVKGATYTIPEPVFPAPKIEGPLIVYKVSHCIEQPLLVHYKPVQYPIASRKFSRRSCLRARIRRKTCTSSGSSPGAATSRSTAGRSKRYSNSRSSGQRRSSFRTSSWPSWTRSNCCSTPAST